MTNHPFLEAISSKVTANGHYICVGLDPDLSKIPSHFPQTMSGLSDFLTQIIESTVDLAIAYKPNISFFEGFGLDGLKLLEKVCRRIDGRVPIIIDGKRGDIGNTSKMQARYMFDYFGADATTLHPYMGIDSLAPFFEYKDKFNFVLSLTSNPSAVDFEKCRLENNKPMYMYVAQTCSEWNSTYKNIGLVVGATQEEMPEIRSANPELLFLVPGVGHQGGSYDDVVRDGLNREGLVLINMSRSILYASNQKDFSEQSRSELIKHQNVV